MTWLATTPGYLAFVAFAAALALLERLYAWGNERRLRADGAHEIAPEVFRVMAPVYALHFVSAAAERVVLGRQVAPAFAAAMALAFVLAKLLKLWAVLSLRDLWTMRVFVPRTPRVVSVGPYRHLRHPNYVAVLLELAALPLAGGCYLTAVLFVGGFAFILRARVRTEEAALLPIPEYAERLGARRRFFPGRTS